MDSLAGNRTRALDRMGTFGGSAAGSPLSMTMKGSTLTCDPLHLRYKGLIRDKCEGNSGDHGGGGPKPPFEAD